MSNFFKKAGSHPLVQRYNRRIDEIQVLSAQIAKAQDEARKLIPRPVYKLISAYTEAFFDERDCVRFAIELQNGEEYQKHMDQFGSLSNPPGGAKSSVAYYRVNGVLLHKGGGNVFFGGRDQTIVLTDEEWEQLLRLEVPQKIKDASTYYTWV